MTGIATGTVRRLWDRILGDAATIQWLRSQIVRLAPFDDSVNPHVPTVLLQGETGTGKGLIARVMHDSGPRRAGPFVEVNCAAIPDALLESELLGFEPGAFTDAKHPKPGLFEVASGGTLFLDEIEALPMSLQGKLLKVIEDKRARRLGAVRDVEINIKLIVATQVDLHLWVAERRFRADLYHRLAVVVLQVPPLRERGDDIVLLARQFLHQHSRAYGLAPKQLAPTAERWLCEQPWPGNVRELSHLMERLTLLHPEIAIVPAVLDRYRLPASEHAGRVTMAPPAPIDPMPDAAESIRQVLARTGGNVVRAARLLGLSRGALRYRMARLGVPVPSDGDLATIAPAPAGPAGKGVSHAPAAAPSAGRDSDALPPMADWERKHVCVLAIELATTAPLDGDGPRHEPWTMLSRWQQAILDTVAGFGGLILQRSPSLMVAVFGIPAALEQQPQRAVQAALAVRRWTSEAVATTPDARLSLRQGLHWGEMLVGPSGPGPTALSLPIGDALAQPVRLLGHATPGDILVSPDMAPLLAGGYDLDPRPTAGAQAVVGLARQRSRIAMYAARPLSGFVGRDIEVDQLRRAQERADRGHGQVVAIVGEAGVGKSRLVYEFTHSPRLQQWLVLETASVSYGKATSYLPVIDLLKGYFKIQDRDDLREVRAKVTGKLLTLDESLNPTASALLALLDVPVDDAVWRTLDPGQRRQQTLDAAKRLLLRETREQPLLLIFEDLHWIDSETQALLDGLVDSLGSTRLLLLVTYRPEYQHAWGSKTTYSQMRLDALPPESAGALLEALLGDDPGLAPLKQLLVKRGNPFFLEETVRTLVETKALVGERGRYRLTQPVQAIQVPATVQAVLAARIDRLPLEDKRLLQVTAVIGKDVPFAVLEAIADLPDAALQRGLDHLRAAEFLYETGLFPDLEYSFTHALTHEVTYGGVLQERRRALHARIVDAIEALYPDRLAEQINRLAVHAVRGEVWEKALHYCRQAGEKDVYRRAYREAVTGFEQALEALRHLPERPDIGVLAVELRCSLANVLSHQGEFQRSVALLGEAEALAQQLDDRVGMRRVLTIISWARRDMGDLDGAIVAGRQALEIAATLGDPVGQASASYRLAQALFQAGGHRQAAELLQGNLETLPLGSPDQDGFLSSIDSRAWLALVLSSLGKFAEGQRHGEEAVRLAMMRQGPARINAHGCLGLLYLAKGDLEAAVRVLESGLAFARAAAERAWSRPMAGALGEAYGRAGRLAEGVALVEEALRDVGLRGALRTQQELGRRLSAVYLLAGRLDEARQHACQALDLARQQKTRGYEALSLFALGAAHAHASPPEVEQAETTYREALALAEPRGMRPLVAHCHLGLGKLYRRTGKRQEAQGHLTTATSMYREIDMSYWLEKAEEELKNG